MHLRKFSLYLLSLHPPLPRHERPCSYRQSIDSHIARRVSEQGFWLHGAWNKVHQARKPDLGTSSRACM